MMATELDVKLVDADKIKTQLQELSDNTQTIEMSLTDFEYVQNDESLCLRELKPSSLNVLHLSEPSLKQLCKFAGAPFGFIVKNPSDLNNRILGHWYPQIENKKKQARLINEEGKIKVRGLLDMEMEYLEHSRVIEILEEQFKGNTYFVSYAGGSAFDEHMQVRVVDKSSQIQIGDDLFAPFVDVITSDIGFGKVQVDAGMICLTRSISFTLRQDMSPYLQIPFVLKETEGSLESVFEQTVSNARNLVVMQSNFFKSKVQESQQTPYHLPELLTLIKGFKELRSVSKGFATNLYKEFSVKNDEELFTHWDLVSRIAEKAVGDARQNDLESFASKVLGYINN